MKRFQKNLDLLVFSLLAFLLAPCCSGPVSTTGNIAGTVKDANTNVNLQGAVVTLNPSGLTVTTGADGNFQFIDVEQGAYKVSVSKTNYQADEKNITVRVDETSTIDFRLKPGKLALEVSPVTLDFGSTDTNLSLDIKNTGQAEMSWEVAETEPWLTCMPTSGSIPAGKTASIIVTVDRASLSRGNYSNTLVVSSNGGGSKNIRVSMVVAVDGASLPQVSMLAVDGVTDVAATFKGSLVKIGTSRVTAHGFCWSKEHNPSLEQGSHQDLGPADGPKQTYTYITPNLSPNTTYYVRAYATNAEGTVYSSREERFTTGTSHDVPRVETGNVFGTTTSGTSVTGNLIYLGHEAGITQHGHVWSSVNPNPTTNGSKTELGAKIETGSFSSTLSGLAPGTLYYIRAYATNIYGTGYGEVVQFTTAVGEVTVTTGDVSNISPNEATCGGHISELQGNNISECGVCWSTNANPTLAGSHAASDSKTEDFSVRMTGLSEQTTYHVRAYVTTGKGETYYGQDKQFQTLAEVILPQASATTVTEIGLNTATLSAEVTSKGNGTISACGFCYSTSTNPTLSDSHVDCVVSSTTFSAILSGLQENTRYYVRAYVTNEKGTSYGAQAEFQTLLTVTLPTLSALSVSDITSKKASFAATIVSLGNGTLTRAGFCYSTSPNPTVSASVLNCGQVTSLRSTTSSLSPQTTYYVRAFAENEKGIAYSEEKTFTTKEKPADTNIGLDDYSDDNSWDNK